MARSKEVTKKKVSEAFAKVQQYRDRSMRGVRLHGARRHWEPGQAASVPMTRQRQIDELKNGLEWAKLMEVQARLARALLERYIEQETS